MHRVSCGDCADVLESLPSHIFDAVLTDPPYGLNPDLDVPAMLRAWLADEDYSAPGRGYQGHAWDASVPGPRKWAAVRRVCKPGAHLLASSAPKTLDLLSLALRLAGWEVRDLVGWCYSTGQVLSKGLPDGSGTGLKGSWEPFLLCRNPFEGTATQCNLDYGTGGLRVYNGEGSPADTTYHPANLIVDDQQPLRDGTRLFHIMKASARERDLGLDDFPVHTGEELTGRKAGSAGIQNARAGAGRSAKERRNPHATVKPVALGDKLTRLLSGPNALVLDPFCGSGSFGISAVNAQQSWFGIDISQESCKVADARVRNACLYLPS